MKRVLIALAATASAFAVTPASAAVLVNGATGVPFNPFGPVAATQGTLEDSIVFDADADTYDAQLRTAVYRNTFGTLDFYYQVAVTQIDALDEIAQLTASAFAGYSVFAFVSGADPDGVGGIFTASANASPLGFTSTASRNGSGAVIRADFGENGLEAAGETSATYIFRTNATQFRTSGTFSTIDGSTVTIDAFEPFGPTAVPEPATWAMMLLGFGAIGSFMRRAPKGVRVSFA